jgi:hypothetical protein
VSRFRNTVSHFYSVVELLYTVGFLNNQGVLT